MRVKRKNTSIIGLKQEIECTFPTIQKAYDFFGVEFVVTSGTERYKHKSVFSRHYIGMAIDIRIRDFTKKDLKMFFVMLKNLLGSQYNIRMEKNHIHIAYKPRFI